MEFKFCVIGHKLYGKSNGSNANEKVEVMNQKNSDVNKKKLNSVYPDNVINIFFYEAYFT